MNLKHLRFVVVSHVYATGPAPILQEYLKDKVENLIYIAHPFSYLKDNRSYLRSYKKGKLVLEKKFIQWNGPEISFYIKDLLLTLWWGLRYIWKADYYIGADNLNAFSGILLKFLGRTKCVIFYTIDYIPNRSNSTILNSIYHFLDKFSVKYCHRVWNLSSIMAEEREKRGVDKRYRDKQLVVPIGTNMSQKKLDFEKIARYKIVFVGHLREGQGVEMLLDAMPHVLKKVPKAKLLIIGGGPLEESLKKQAKEQRIKENVTFTGFVKNFSDVAHMLQHATIAVAPYVDDEKTYTRYTDPGKPKDYLANSLPVIITKVPQVAYEIEKNKCGIAINYNKEELVAAIIELLTDKKKLITYRENALTMAKRYTWDKVFSKALKETFRIVS